MINKIGLTTVAFLSLFLINCGETAQLINASPTEVQAATIPCSGKIEETDWGIRAELYSCNTGVGQQLGYRLQRDHQLQAFNVWIGTPFDSELEMSTHLIFVSPSHKRLVLRYQWDKHSDVDGNIDEWRTYWGTIPRGTVVQVSRGPGLCSVPVCQTHILWQVYDANQEF